MSRHPLVVGNWKMNGTRESTVRLCRELEAACGAVSARTRLAVCVPFPYLGTVAKELEHSSIRWGAQTVSQFDFGAHTGDVSPPMLKEFGCTFVLVGHSERRQFNGESDRVVADKVRSALEHDLTPIICVGETFAEWQLNLTAKVAVSQLEAAIGTLKVEELRRCVIAYEPVWAIGTGLSATPEQAQSVHRVLRERLARINKANAHAVQILYGGSITPSNAAELFAQPDIDGGLVGGASLVATDFISIAAATHPFAAAA